MNDLYGQLINAVSALSLINKKEEKIQSIIMEAKCKKVLLDKTIPDKPEYVKLILGGLIPLLYGLIVGIVAGSVDDPAVGLGVFIVCAIPAMICFPVAYSKKVEYEKRLAEHKEWEEEFDQENQERKKQIAVLQEEMRAMQKSYADYLAVLPASYRDLPAASYFLTAVRDGRADDMKEAMNLYEQQLHNWKMEKAFEDMTKLQKYQNQFISDALNEIQRNQEVIHSDLSAIMTMQAVDLIAK